MKLKELLIVIPMALLISLGMQYFFGWHKFPPQEQEEEKPLYLEVDFLDKKTSKKPQNTVLETEHVHYKFSTEGAALESIEFKRNWGGKEGYLATIFEPPTTERDRKCFLVALDSKTPYHFDLVENKEEHDRFVLTYEADFEDGVMRKQFSIFKELYRIDLALTISPRGEGQPTFHPRMFFPSPLVPELGKKDTIKGIVCEAAGKLQFIDLKEENLKKSWKKPTLFGTQDRYFVHALVHDEQHFANRGYFKVFDLENLYSVIEGAEGSAQGMWNLTFYVGPKEDAALAAVDPRLEQTLNYGWFGAISGPVSKILLRILNFFYDYVKNYGVAIIILTFLMKLVLLPFGMQGDKSMKKSLEYKKKLEYLQVKYKDDKEALRIAQTELVRKHGMPGLSGCLTALLQVPLFIALSWVISNSIELFMAPFLWIPDLSSPDPWYILPILVGVAMLFHTPTIDPKQRVSTFIIAIAFAAFSTTFSTTFAAGLVLYILTSTALGVLQSHGMKRFA